MLVQTSQWWPSGMLEDHSTYPIFQNPFHVNDFLQDRSNRIPSLTIQLLLPTGAVIEPLSSRAGDEGNIGPLRFFVCGPLLGSGACSRQNSTLLDDRSSRLFSLGGRVGRGPSSAIFDPRRSRAGPVLNICSLLQPLFDSAWNGGSAIRVGQSIVKSHKGVPRVGS